MTTINLTINGQPHTIDTPPMKRLLDVLREDLNPCIDRDTRVEVPV